MEAGKAPRRQDRRPDRRLRRGAPTADGQIRAEELDEIEKAACPTCGSCSGMFTANSMNCLAEALGMALPGNGTILATSADRKRLFVRGRRSGSSRWPGASARRAGPRLLPREIASPARVRQRDDPRHGDGREHQHRAPHPGHRPRGGRAVHAWSGSTSCAARRRTSARSARSSRRPHRGRRPRRRHPHDPRRGRPRRPARPDAADGPCRRRSAAALDQLGHRRAPSRETVRDFYMAAPAASRPRRPSASRGAGTSSTSTARRA